MSNFRLTYSEVAAIRRGSLCDAVVARECGVHIDTVRCARVGKSWRAHPAKPDRKRRIRRGRWGNLTS